VKMMYGKGTSEHGPGVDIELSGDEVAVAIMAYLTAHGAHVRGPRTVTVNGHLCVSGRVYVDPSGFAINSDSRRFSGRGPEGEESARVDTKRAGKVFLCPDCHTRCSIVRAAAIREDGRPICGDCFEQYR